MAFRSYFVRSRAVIYEPFWAWDRGQVWSCNSATKKACSHPTHWWMEGIPFAIMFLICSRISRLKVNKARKCQFVRNTCAYFGHVVGEGKLEPAAWNVAFKTFHPNFEDIHETDT